MAIGTPVQLLVAANVGSGSANTTGADAPAGSLIVVYIATWNGLDGTVTSVTDSAGNTYSLAVQPSATASQPYPCAIFYCSNSANDLPSGGTITATASGGDNLTIGAWAVSGANGGLDTSTSTASNDTMVSLSTGTLAASSEIIFGGVATRGNLGTLTDPGSFTELFFSETSAHQPFAYDIVSSNTSVTYDPSWSNSAAFAAVLASFKATSSGGDTIDAGSGSFSFSGTAATFNASASLGEGSYAFSGASVTLDYFSPDLSAGVYTFNGSQVSLIYEPAGSGTIVHNLPFHATVGQLKSF